MRWVKCRILDFPVAFSPTPASLPDEILLGHQQQLVLFQSKGISSSSLKHLRYLKRFLSTMNSYKSKYPGPGGAGGAVGYVGHSPPGPPGQQPPHPSALRRPRPGEESRHAPPPPHPAIPYPPLPRHLKIEEPEEEDEESIAVEPEMKRRRFFLDPARVSTAVSEAASAASTSAAPDNGHRFIEQFNADMMQQFLAHQRKVQGSFQRWEMDRQRQHEAAMERWRGEARAHEKEMFGMFVAVMGECNNALTNMLRCVSTGLQ